MDKTMDLVLPLTAEFEGFRSKVYKCPAGFDTIGYGRNIEANPLSEGEKAQLNADGSVSEAVAKEWLREYLEKCYKELDKSFSWFSKMDCVRKAALVDFNYNVGLGTLKTFKNTLRFFEAGNYKQAAANMRQSKWYAQVKRRGVKICDMVESGQA